MIVLGLDTATKTGWCFYDTDSRAVIESGVQDFTKKRGESNGLMFLRFRKWLDTLIKVFPPDLVGYEQAHHRGGASTEMGVGLTTRIQEICAKHKIEPAPVHTTTLKKFATGKGNASKDEMVAAATKILMREPIDDNEADAVHVARHTAAEYAV